MNSALATVLNKVLGDFVEGFNGEQLNVSLFSGKLQLEKMLIRPQAIDQLGLPVVLRYGIINSIEATIPWTALGSSPLKVEVRGVYLLFRPRTPDMWSNEQVLDAIEAGKQGRLDRFEFMNSDQLAAAQAPGFVDKLVSKIVDNLQISLSNVYIRYEDFQSSSEHFAAGLIVKQAEVATCNAAWEAEFVVDSPITYKSAEVVGLALYLDYGEGCEVDSSKIPGKSPEKSFENLSRKESDLNFLIKHRFILSACSCTWHFTLSKNASNLTLPRVAIEMQLGGAAGVEAGLELKQVTHCVKLMEFFGQFGTFQAGVQATVAYRELVDAEGEEYRGLYIDWKLKPEDGRKEVASRLKTLEKNYDLDSITKQRRAAQEEMKLFEQEEEAKKALSSAAQTTSGGFKAFFGFGKSKATQEQEEAEKKEKLEAAEREVQRIREAREHFRQELATFLESAPTFVDLPQTYERFKVKVELGSVHWTLRSDSMDLLSTQLDASTLEAVLRVSGMSVAVRAGPFSLKDLIEPSDLYPRLLEVDGWTMEYTDFPTEEVKKLELKTGESFCTVNVSSVFTLIREVKTTVLAEIDVESYRETLEATVRDLMQRGKNYMQDLARQGIAPQSLQVSLHCKAPCLLIPLDLKCRTALVADFGLLTLQTSSATRDWNGLEDTRTEQAVYDKYQFTASDFVLATLWDFREARQWRSGRVDTILTPSPFSLCISSAVFPQIDPVIDITGKIERLQGRLSDIQMQFILQLQAFVLATKARLLPSAEALDLPEETIEHTEMLKDTMKRSGKLIGQRIVLEVGTAAADLYRGQECLAHCELTALRGELRLHEDSRLVVGVSMREIRLLDARQGQGFPVVVSMLAGSTAPAIDLKCALTPAEDKARVVASMSHLSILFNPDFISTLIAFFTLSPLPQLAHSQSLVSPGKCTQLVASKSERRLRQQEITIHCTAFSVLVLESQTSKTLLRLRFDATAEYRGRMEYVDLLNSKEEVFSREVILQEDTGNVQVSELEVSVGELPQVQALQSYRVIKAQLFSARSIEVRMSSVLRESVTEVVLTVDIRQLGLILGFADIRTCLSAKDFCLSLASQGATSPVSPTAAKENSTSYSLSAYTDEISACLVDDTEHRFLPLLRLRLPACSLSFKYSALKLQAALAIALAVDYRNGSAAAYEPLLESWTLEVSVDQQVGEQDNLMAITAISRSPMSINLSAAAGKVLAKVLQKWQEGVDSWQYGEGLVAVVVDNALQYKVKNRLGRPVIICLEGFFETITIENGQSHILPEGKWRLEGETVAYSPIHALSVRVESLGVARCVLLDEVGQSGYPLQGSSYWLVCRVAFQSYYRVITLSSDLQFCNNTEIPVTLRWPSGEVSVQPSQAVNSPIGCPMAELTLLTPAGSTNLRLLSQMRISENAFAVLDQVQTKCGSGLHTTYFLNPPITVQNLLPGTIKVAFSSDPRLVYTVPAGGERRVYTQSVTGRVECSWEVLLGAGVDLCCRLQQLKGERSLFPLSGQAEEHVLVVDRITNESLVCGKVDLSLEKVKNKVFAGLLLQPHCPLWLVNHTSYILDCIDSEDARISLPASTFLMANSFSPSLRVRVNEHCFGKASSWSKAFSTETAGLSGALALETSSKSVPSVSLGIQVEQGTWPLLKTRVLHIYPRFVVRNLLPSTVYLKQRKEKNTAAVLQPGEHCDYQLAQPNAGSCLQVSTDEQHWSCPFSIEDVGDFQIRFLALESQRESHWWTQNTSLGLMQCAQVSVTSENQAVIVTQLAVPETPDFLVLNETQEQIAVCQDGCKDRTLAMPGASVPFVFDDQFAGSRKVRAILGKAEQLYNIEKVGKSHKKLGVYHVETCVQAGSRVLRIYTDSDHSSRLLQVPARFSNWKAVLQLDRLILALLDEQPKEQFLLSLSFLQASMTSLDCGYQDLWRTEQYVNLLLGSVQIDNMSGKPAEFEVILSQVQRKEEEATPVLQVEIKRNMESRRGSAEVFQCFEYIRVSLQELRLDLHQATLMRLAKVVQKELSPFQNQLEQKPFAEAASFIDIAAGLAPQSAEHLTRLQPRAKSYFQLIVLYAAVVNLSIKTSPHKVNAMMEEAHAIAPIRSLHRMGAALINISGSKLKFSTVMLKDSFSSLQDIQSQVLRNYLRQGYWQVYRLIGSSDMLGNPIGLINKLGSGVFELFNEPRKGLLQGPTEFAQGVRRGVKSFVSNVISGGMGSVSKITGSFYGLLRVAQGDEEGYERINRPDSAAAGVLEGLKGGLTDLAEGVSGIFTKPVEGIKKGGFGGFLRGVKSGLVGAVTAPVSAVLRTGTTITSGISNSASSLSNTLPPTRSRLPRQTTARKVVEPYSEPQAHVQAAFRSLKRFRGENPLFSSRCREGVVILTPQHIVHIADSSDCRFLSLSKISTIQLRPGLAALLTLTDQEGSRLEVSGNPEVIAQVQAAVRSLAIVVKS